MTAAAMKGAAGMSVEGNKEVVRRALALASSRDLDAAAECMAVDLLRNGEPTDRAAERRRDEVLASAFPDFEYAEQELVAEGDQVALRWRMTGTQSGELVGPTMSLPPSGRRLDIVGTSFLPAPGRPDRRGVGDLRPDGLSAPARGAGLASPGLMPLITRSDVGRRRGAACSLRSG